EKVETAVDAGFQQHFVDAMGIPHGSHAFTELAKAVDLPKTAAPQRAGRRRRRRKG
ncbi:MAG: hypothetical protein HKP02_07335, partial [Xanthomonadales bacterium]|nr:hypothetical protein [Xanthomonadales bacterium]